MRARTKKSVKAWRAGAGLASLFVFAFVFLYIGIPGLSSVSYQASRELATTTLPEEIVPEARKATHVPTPDPVKAIYMTACVASTPSLRENLVRLIRDTELDAVVIDIKSFDGHLSFMPKDPSLQKAATGDCFVKDMQDLIDEIHEKGIYVIGRVASFQDQFMVKERPDLAVKKESDASAIWRDYKGIAWIDASSKEHWEYLAKIAREAHDIGFDEINFDYIRFPADGDMRDIYFPLSGNRPKKDVIHDFYRYLHETLSPEGIAISGDVFGMTTTNTDDLNIGQILEYALENFDYVMPMVYPSHYPANFMNLGDPNKHAYEVVKISMDSAVKRALATSTVEEFDGARIGTSTPAIYAKPRFDTKKLRPWLQDNNYPVPYTPEMVRAQIKADYDAGLASWALWNAGNRYTREALLAE